MNENYPKNHREELRDRAFKILGGCCCQCREEDPIVLTIDHIEPCGKNRKLTISLYYEIIREPEKAREKYQLLCRNCNWRKMITNNERVVESPFASKAELDELSFRLHMLEKMFKSTEQKIKANAQLTEMQIENIIEPVVDNLLDKRGKIDVSKMRLYLREQHGIFISSWQSYNIKRNLENKFHKKFLQ